MPAYQLSKAALAVLRPTRAIFVLVAADGTGVVEDRSNRATMRVSSLVQFQRSWSMHGSARQA